MDLTPLRKIRPFAWFLQIVLLLPAPALAQFIGFTSPQTVTQTLGKAHQPCTDPTPGFPGGQEQTFDVQNLGQTEHYLKVAADNGNAVHFSVRIVGVDITGIGVNISDQLEMAGAQFTGSLFASGWFPKVQVIVACAPSTATYTLTYSGTWGTPTPTAGSFFQSRIDRQLWHGVTGVNSLSLPTIPPFGSSAGVAFVQFLSAPVSGSTLAVQCENQSGSWIVVVLSPTTIAGTTTLQEFQVPNFPCPLMAVNFLPGGGATTSSVSLAFAFGAPGFSDWPLTQGVPAIAAHGRPGHNHHH
jgi:hypothetical protein